MSFEERLSLPHIHDATLAPYISDCLAKGLEIVRRILNLVVRKWRDERGLTWLEIPPLLTMQEVDDARAPYPLNWEEQKFLIKELPDHLARMAQSKYGHQGARGLSVTVGMGS